LDLELRMELNTGLLETHGALTGENKDFSDSSEASTTSPLKLTAPGPLQ